MFFQQAFFIILAIIFYTFRSLFEKKVSLDVKSKVNLLFYTTIFLFFLSTLNIIIKGSEILFETNVFLIALLRSSFYFLSLYFFLKALEKLDLSTTLSLRRLNNIFCFLLVLFFFKEKLSLFNLLAVFLAILSIFIISEISIKIDKRYFYYALLSLVFTTLDGFVSKFGAYSKDLFLFYTYLILIFLLLFKIDKKMNFDLIKYSFIYSILIFLAYYSFLSALVFEPSSIVYPIVGSYVALVSFFSKFIFNEKFDIRKLLAIGLAISSIILINF